MSKPSIEDKLEYMIGKYIDGVLIKTDARVVNGRIYIGRHFISKKADIHFKNTATED